MRTLLEFGCGPAWHSIEHAKKVLIEDNIAITATTTSNNSNKNLSSKNNDSGIVSVALDVNKEMVSYAIERASDERAVLDVVDVVLGDMRDLSTHLPEKYLKSGGYFDCATLLLGTAAHLLTCEDATRTFREAFKCLREDGIFVVEVEHPMTTLFSGELKYQDGDENAWEVSLGRSRKSIGRSDDRSNNSSTIRREEEDEDDASEREETMRVVWGDPENDFFDAKNQVLHRTVSVQKYFSVDVAARDDDDDDGEEEEEDKEDEEIEEEEENDNFEEEAVIKALFVRDPHYESKEIVKCKLFTLPELMAVANAAGFEFIECFGDLDETSVGTSVHVLRAAYKPAMNRCRCHLKSEKQWLAESASRSASMVSLESFAQRQSEDAKDAENEADGAENEETKKGNIKRRKERRRSAGLHCQRCLKRTRKGVRVSFLTSPALVGFVSGAIAFGFSSASAFALRRGKGVLFGALANAQPTKSSKTKKKKK
ncbi:unnamed protein product [Bathycoccus prasinos]